VSRQGLKAYAMLTSFLEGPSFLKDHQHTEGEGALLGHDEVLQLFVSLPRGQWPQRGSEAGHAPRPPFSECLLHQFALRGRVYLPEGAFACFFLGTRHFDKLIVQRDIVAG
jgi:hypothetical protein